MAFARQIDFNSSPTLPETVLHWIAEEMTNAGYPPSQTGWNLEWKKKTGLLHCCWVSVSFYCGGDITEKVKQKTLSVSACGCKGPKKLVRRIRNFVLGEYWNK